MNLMRRIWRAHQDLPRLVRLQWIIPLTLALVVLGGNFFTLPPGPLCDEGMVLFMEGGCDWGPSNMFFFSKLGLLVSLNVAFVVAWFGGVRGFMGLVPHFLLALSLALVTWSGGRCDSYYGHPNGSIGQMILEIAAFALLGVVLLLRWQKGAAWKLALMLTGWNLLHVTSFYVWLVLFRHWTWGHTALVILSLVVTGGILSPNKSLKPTRLARGLALVR